MENPAPRPRPVDAGAPRELTRPPLVGRDDELDELIDRLRARAGWVSLVGPPGIGKTRLAREVVRRWQQDPGDETHWLELPAGADAAELDQAAALALGLRHGPGFDGFGPALGARGRCLLVLDLPDVLQPGITAEVLSWLAEAPSLRVLTASRRQIGPTHHETMVLGALEAPEPAGALDSPAWTLLTTMAPRGALDGVTPEDAHAILASLDGNPLMLGLAAGRLELLRPADLVEGLKRPLELLRDPDQPRRSLRAVLEQSCASLTAGERDVLGRCGVVEGPFTLDDARELLGDDWASAVDALHLLVRAHLLLRDGDGLRMSNGVRAFARDLLTGEERADALARHARWAIGRSDETDPLDELRAVVQRALQGELPSGPGIAAGVAMIRILSGRSPAEALLRLADALLGLPHAADEGGSPELMLQRGRILRQSGLYEEARSALRDAAAAAGDAEIEGRCLSALAQVADCLDEPPDDIVDLIRRAIRLADPQDADLAASLQSQLAWALLGAGQTVEAVDAHLRHALELVGQRTTPDAMDVLTQVGWHYRDLQPDLAERCYRRVEAAATQQRDGTRLAIAQFNLAALAQEADRDRAEALYRSAHEHWSRLGQLGRRAVGACEIGRVVAQRGDFEEAYAWLEQGLERAGSSTDPTFLKIEVVRRLVAAPLGRTVDGPPPEGVVGSWAVPLVERGFAMARQGDRTGVAEIVDALRSELRQTPVHLNNAIVAAVTDRLERDVTGWRIDAGGRWLLAPRQSRPQELELSATQLRVALRLVRARLALPGDSLGVDELFEAGWPGENAVPSARGNRVRVALSGLRSAGLRDLLVRDRDGWKLDPEADVELVEG